LDDRRKKELDQFEARLRDFLSDKTVNEATYFKLTLNLIYDYVHENDYTKATSLFQRISLDYIKSDLSRQMEIDDEFLEVCFLIAEGYIDSCLISLEEEFNFNKPPEEA